MGIRRPAGYTPPVDPNLRRLLTRVSAAAGIASLGLIGGPSAEADTGPVFEQQCISPGDDGLCRAPDDALVELYLLDSAGAEGCTTVAIIGDDTPTPGEDGLCCYQTEVTCPQDTGFSSRIGCMGRPMRVDGEMVQAAVRGGARRRISPPAGLSTTQRATLAEFWTQIALAEYASIAEFHRTCLELLRFGAPDTLIAGAQRAALDEARHAKRAFELASRYAGETIAPGPLPLPERVPLASSLVEFARSTLRDGCGAETCSAWLYAQLSLQAADPAVKRVMDGIVRDETRHAELAWAVVRWAVQTGGPVVREAVAIELEGEPPVPIGVAVPDDPVLRHHGWAPTAEQLAIVYESWRSVVRPVGQALLRSAA